MGSALRAPLCLERSGEGGEEEEGGGGGGKPGRFLSGSWEGGRRGRAGSSWKKYFAECNGRVGVRSVVSNVMGKGGEEGFHCDEKEIFGVLPVEDQQLSIPGHQLTACYLLHACLS